MNIIFVCDNTAKTVDANLHICQRLAHWMQQQGHTAVMLGNCEQRTDARQCEVDGIPYVRFYYPINRITHSILQQYQATGSKAGLVLSLCRHPLTALVGAVRWLCGFNPIENKYRAAIQKLAAAVHADAVIAEAGSFYTVHALAGTQLPCRKIGYMLDPYWKNHITGGQRAKKEELFAWAHLDAMAVPPLLASDYNAPEFCRYKSKMLVTEFPGIAQCTQAAGGEPDGKIHLLFAGNFYADIRSPQRLYALLQIMDARVVLHVVGSRYGQEQPQTMALEARLAAEGKLCLHGSLTHAQALAAMQRADILINIGNTVENQLPSKIFEYFSAGKPVVHLRKIKKDPCLPYLQQYPCALVLDEQADLAQNEKAFAAFCAQYAGTAVPFDTVQSIFKECTAAYVGQQLLTAVQKQ